MQNAPGSAHLLDCNFDALRGVLTSWGLPAYRAAQVWEWLYARRAPTWDAMSNLPAALRRDLQTRCPLPYVGLLEKVAAGDGTTKLLAGLPDGERVECVILPAGERCTVCISSQAGCRFRCAFCASGQAGFLRNLAPGEIVGQALLAARETGDRPDNIVFMGIGEPLDNYDSVLCAIRILNDPRGMNIGARRITISTCGVVPGIRRLAGEGLQVELSVSLHAPDDELRSRLMPVNRRHPLSELLAACREYTAETNRIITFEYTLVAGLNDTPDCAARLTRLLHGLSCRVNLIPLSPVAEFDGRAPDRGSMEHFLDRINRAGIHATLRNSKGGALKAACGQLRFRKEAESGAARTEATRRTQRTKVSPVSCPLNPEP